MNLQEDFCSQELYKLLIDKGFEVDCYDAPFTQRLVTHQMAMKWLRETHNVFIGLRYDVSEQKYIVNAHPMSFVSPRRRYERRYKDVYQAIETAIKYSLENLI